VGARRGLMDIGEVERVIEVIPEKTPAKVEPVPEKEKELVPA
jgi:hypothetical protein